MTNGAGGGATIGRKKKSQLEPKVSPKARARANERLRKKWRAKAAKAGRSGTPPEVLKKVFSGKADLPPQDKKADSARAAKVRAEASLARKEASSTSPGKGKLSLRGKPRGTGGRLTKGS